MTHESKAARGVRLARERVVRAAKRWAETGTRVAKWPHMFAAADLIGALAVLAGAEKALRAERRAKRRKK